MSMDLYIWKGPVTDDPDEAQKLFDRYFDDKDESQFDASPAISAMSADLLKLYPAKVLRGEEALAAMSDEDRERAREVPIDEVVFVEGDVPWSDFPFDASDRLLIVSLPWSADDALANVMRLAAEHDLLIYDPQGPSVHLPGDPLEAEPDQRATFADYLGIFRMVAFFAALTFGAWWIPVGWLRWPAMLVGGFLTAASLLVVFAMAESSRESTKGRKRHTKSG